MYLLLINFSTINHKLQEKNLDVLRTAETMLLEWYKKPTVSSATLHNVNLMLDNIEMAIVLEDSTVKTKVYGAHHKFSAHQ